MIFYVYVTKVLNLLQVTTTVLNNAVLVDCVSNHIDQTIEIPMTAMTTLTDHQITSTTTTLLNSVKTCNESIKCEPDILIKVEEVSSNPIVNNTNHIESESDSESDSDSGSDTDDSSVNDNDGIDSNSLGDGLEPSVDHNR